MILNNNATFVDYSINRFRTDFRGTGNIGMSCFFNVCLRTLFYHPVFMQALKDYATVLGQKKPDSHGWTNLEKYYYNLYLLLHNKKPQESARIFSFLYCNLYVLMHDRINEGMFAMQDAGQTVSAIIEKFNYLAFSNKKDQDREYFLQNEGYVKDPIVSYVNEGTKFKISYDAQQKKYFFEETKKNRDNNVSSPMFSSWSYDANQRVFTCSPRGDDNYKTTMLAVGENNFSDVVVVDHIGNSYKSEQKVLIQKGVQPVKVKTVDLNLDLISNITLNGEEYVLASCGLHSATHWTMLSFIGYDDNIRYYNDGNISFITRDEAKSKIKSLRLGPMVYIRKNCLGQKIKYESPQAIKCKISDNEQNNLLKTIENAELTRISNLRKIICKLIDKGILSIDECGIIDKAFYQKTDNFYIAEEDDPAKKDKSRFSLCDRSKIVAAYQLIEYICYQRLKSERYKNIFLNSLNDVAVGQSMVEEDFIASTNEKAKKVLEIIDNIKLWKKFEQINDINNNRNSHRNRPSIFNINIPNNLNINNLNNNQNNNDEEFDLNFTPAELNIEDINNDQQIKFNNNDDDNISQIDKDNSLNEFNILDIQVPNNLSLEYSDELDINDIEINDPELDKKLALIDKRLEKIKQPEQIVVPNANVPPTTTLPPIPNVPASEQPQQHNDDEIIIPNAPNVNAPKTREIINPNFYAEKARSGQPKKKNSNSNKINYNYNYNKDEEYKGNQQYSSGLTFKNEIPPRPVIEFWVYLLCIILIGFLILLDKLKKQKEWDRKYKNSNNYSGNNFYNLNNSDRRIRR